MLNKRRIFTVGGTLFCALATGYLMQANAKAPAPAPKPVGVVETLQDQALPGNEVTAALSSAGGSVLRDDKAGMVHLASAKPMPPAAAPQPAPMPTAPVKLAALSTDERATIALPREEPAPGMLCDIAMEARAAAAAMVDLTLTAPCMKNERLTLHHNGMMISQMTDAAGDLSVTLPALSSNAIFIAAFANGDGAVAKAEVTSLEYYDRLVVQWEGHSGLQIHALEYGAGYGDAGHVWSGAAGNLAQAAKGEGGFVTRLGAAELERAQMAEVYTFPTMTAARGGDVRLSVEAQVTPLNCGRDIEAQSIRISGAKALKVKDLVVSIPDCDAVGDFLVLKNLINDLKIARNQ